MENVKKRKSSKSIFFIIIAVLALAAGIYNYKTENSLFDNIIYDGSIPASVKDYKMSVHFLDVGKADCAYIKCGDKNILIDAADKDTSNKVEEYLKRQNVEKLDLAIMSHAHRDHIGQIDDIIRDFKIDKFIMSDIPRKLTPTSKTYLNMLKALDERDVNTEIVKAGDKLVLGDLLIDIFGPINVYDDINNTSLVIKITFGEDSFLFTGDASEHSELDMVKSGFNLKSTVLKVGHHGSKTSTTLRFLENVSPDFAVISVGPDKNNLPNENIIKRLAYHNIKTYRTDTCGNIICLTNGDGVRFETEKGEN